MKRPIQAANRFLVLPVLALLSAVWVGPARAENLIVDGVTNFTGSFSGSYDSILVGETKPSTLNILDSASVTCGGGNFYVGDAGAAGEGTVNVSGGTLTANGSNLWIGWWARGVMNISGGTANLNTTVIVYYEELNVSSGTLNVTNWETKVGWDGGSLLSVSGGTANLYSINMSHPASRCFLTGGTLNLGAGGLYGDAASTINLGGGIFRASDTWSSSLPMHLNVEGTNVTFDPNGFDIMLSGELSGAGGLTVDATGGAGALILSGTNTYTGATVISRGTLKLDTVGLFAGTNITMGAGGVFDVTNKPNYTMPAANTYTFDIDPAGTGQVGRISAAGLDISSGRVAFAPAGRPDDPTYVVADYTSLTGTKFADMSGFPSGFSIDYNYKGRKQIALVRIPLGTVISIE